MLAKGPELECLLPLAACSCNFSIGSRDILLWEALWTACLTEIMGFSLNERSYLKGIRQGEKEEDA